MGTPKIAGLPGRCKKCGRSVVLWTEWGWVNADNLLPHRCKIQQPRKGQTNEPATETSERHQRARDRTSQW